MNRPQRRFAKYVTRNRNIEKNEKLKTFINKWFSEPQTLIRSMTNWQRHQWAKAGYPEEKIAYYSQLTKEKNKALQEQLKEL